MSEPRSRLAGGVLSSLHLDRSLVLSAVAVLAYGNDHIAELVAVCLGPFTMRNVAGYAGLERCSSLKQFVMEMVGDEEWFFRFVEVDLYLLLVALDAPLILDGVDDLSRLPRGSGHMFQGVPSGERDHNPTAYQSFPDVTVNTANV